MRCPSCHAWVTPDLESCPKCSGALGGGSILEKYERQIHTSRERTRGRTDNPFSGPPSFTADPTSALERAGGDQVRLEAQPLGVLNLLLMHAGFSPFRSISVTSSSGDGLAGTRLRITSRPPVVQPVSMPLADLGTGGELTPPAVAPDHGAFLNLDEALQGQLDLAVLYEDTTLAETAVPVTVMAGDEWVGLEGVEASLAGAVTPRAPAVEQLVADLARDWPSYQDQSPERMARDASEIYEAIRRLDLHYIVTASFEPTGQKVLLPEQVIGRRRGCCLDIAVLTAAILEHVGYNPVIVLVDRHAYSGVWTSDVRATAPVLRDAGAIREAVSDGMLLVWNSTTYFDRDGDTSLGAAVRAGVDMLSRLQYVIDLAACRAHGFKPLPRRSA